MEKACCEAITIRRFVGPGIEIPDRAIVWCKYRHICPDAKDFNPNGINKTRKLDECKKYREYEKGDEKAWNTSC